MAMTQEPTESTAASPVNPMEPTPPTWWQEFASLYRAGEGIVFALSGDVRGYVTNGISHTRYLYAQMAARERIILQYDLASGITFPGDEMRVMDAAAEAGVEEEWPAKSQGGIDREAALRILSGAAPAAPKPADDFASMFAEATAGMAPKPAPRLANQREADQFDKADTARKAMLLLEQVLRGTRPDPRTGKGGACVIINLADLLLPRGDKGTLPPERAWLLGTLLNLANDPTFGRMGNPVFLVAPRLSDLHADLLAADSGIRAVEVKLPDVAARHDYVARWLDGRAANGRPVPSELSTRELANLTAGLSLRHVQDILLQSARQGGVTHALVKARKDEIIRSTFSDIAEMIEPLPTGFAAIGGMATLKRYFQAEVIEAVRKGSRRVPRGILLVGPPGTGKSYIVRALAKEVGFNAVALNMSRILGGIVGESEANLRRFFEFVRALSPCLVFLDELDQSDVANRGQGSGNPVAGNLFNMMLTFMSDETLRGKVIAVFASNRPDLMDPALLRFGRMDAIIPVLLPDAESRQQIILVQAQGQGLGIAPKAAKWLAAATEKYSAADLGGVVAKAAKLAERAGHAQIEQDDVERARAYIRPNTPQIADEYTTLALSACNDGEFLPPELAAKLANRAALKQEVRAAQRDLSNAAAYGDREERAF